MNVPNESGQSTLSISKTVECSVKVRIQQLETGFTRAKRAKMRSVSLILFVIHLIALAGLIHFEIGKVQWLVWVLSPVIHKG